VHTTRQPRALARHEQAPFPCLRSACLCPSPARRRPTRRQRRALLQGHPERRWHAMEARAARPGVPARERPGQPPPPGAPPRPPAGAALIGPPLGFPQRLGKTGGSRTLTCAAAHGALCPARVQGGGAAAARRCEAGAARRRRRREPPGSQRRADRAATVPVPCYGLALARQRSGDRRPA